MDREAGFRRGLALAGHDTVHCYTKKMGNADRPGWISADEKVAAWLAALPRPIGIFACNDVKCRELALICQEAGIRVPEEAALIGVDDDDIICRSALPPLSSVSLPAEQVGYEAAALLERLMSGQAPPTKPIRLPPLQLITRQSSDILLIEIPEVAEAVRFIREHAHEQIGVEDVLRRVPVNRRWLERMFRQTLSRTPLEEINQVRIARAKRLLITTDLSMPRVAEQSGFDSARRLNSNFQNITSMSPSAYRLQFRLRSGATEDR